MRTLPSGSAFSFALLIVVMTSAPTAAQHLAASGVVAGDAVPTLVPEQSFRLAPQHTPPARAGYELPLRVLLGTGGSFLGAYAGAVAGFALPHQGCDCEFEGLGRTLAGAAIGSTLLGAALASAPPFSSDCKTLRRLGRGVLGALGGALTGGVAGATFGAGGVAIGYIADAGIGAAISSGTCG